MPQYKKTPNTRGARERVCMLVGFSSDDQHCCGSRESYLVCISGNLQLINNVMLRVYSVSRNLSRYISGISPFVLFNTL